jgi:hypothetical protein
MLRRGFGYIWMAVCLHLAGDSVVALACLSDDVVGPVDAGLGPAVCVQVLSRASSATNVAVDPVDAGLGPSGVVVAEFEPYDGGALHATFESCKAGLVPFVTGPPT